MKPPVIVRHAEPDDERALVDLYIALHREGLGRIFPYNYQKVIAGIQLATRKQGAIAGVIDAPNLPGSLAGVVFLLHQTWWWSDSSFILLRECYVRKEYRRGTGYFAALHEFAEAIRISHNDARPVGDPPVVLEASFIEGDPRRWVLMNRLWARWGKRIGTIRVSGL